MAFSWKRLGTTLSIGALITILLGIGYFWSRDFAEPEPSPGSAAAPAYTSPCVADAAPLPRVHRDPNTGAQKTTLKIASIAPQSSHYAKRLIAAASDIKERTSGRVVMKIYFGGVQGDASRVLRKMRAGILHGATFSAAELAGRYPDIALYRLPFLFRSPGEIAHVREKLDTRLHEGLEEAGLVSFCIASAGFSRLMSTAPIRSRVDLLGRKVWIPEDDPTGDALFRAPGVATLPLPVGDVMVGLQTQLIDVAPVTPVGAVLMQWYTQFGYLTRLPLQYEYGLLTVDRKTFDKIAPGDQAVVRSMMNSLFQEFDSAAWHDEAEALLALDSGGIKMVHPDTEWAEELQKLGDEVAVQLIQGRKISPELYNQVRALIEEYRAAN